MTKSTEHCMPNTTPMKPYSFINAKKYYTVDRCSQLKSMKAEEYMDAGFDLYRDIEKEKYSYSIPIENEGFASFAQKISKKKFKNRLSVDEVDLIIRDKFKFDRHSLFQLFNAADVHKKGFLTKEALLQVIYTICNNVTVDHFYKLLEKYNLNSKPVITYKEIENAFTDPPVGKYKAPIIFHGMGNPRKMSSAYALHLLKEAALDKDFDLKAILPESCFTEDGIILMPQFREALGRIQIVLCDENFIRLWNKLDKKGVGSIPFRDFLTVLNLQDSGKPMCGLRQPLIPLRRPKIDRVVRTKPPLKYTNCYQMQNKDQQLDIGAGGISFPLIRQHGWTPKGCGGTDEYDFGKGTQFLQGLKMLRNNRPHFYSIHHTLSYIFEEPYQEMLIIFHHYDQKDSGFVSVDVGIKIMNEFGFTLEYDNFKTFLMKNNILDPNNGINYKQLINKFQIKGPGTRVSRMISSIINSQYQSTGLKSLKTMSVEEIEEELYKVLHRDFIRFKSELQKCSQKEQYVCENDFRRIVECLLGYKMTKCQWTDLQKSLLYETSKCENINQNQNENQNQSKNQNRLVDYVNFINQFNKPTGICRYRNEASEEDALGWIKQKDRTKVVVYDPPRNSELVCRLVADTLKFRFHKIDKTYKAYGTGIRGSFTKDILHELLNGQKCKLTPVEMDVIWAVVEANPNHNSFDYRQILKQLMINLYKRAEEFNIESRKLTSADSNIEVLQDFRRKHKDDKIKREAVDLHKIEMALKIKSFDIDQDKAKFTIVKMTPRMNDIWIPFKKQLRKLDLMGKASVELFEMKELLVKNKFHLTKDELENILYYYDTKKIGRFDYISFLKEFVSIPVEEVKLKSDLHFDKVRHRVFNQKDNSNITMIDLYTKLREWLIKEWKSLIRAFRKLDSNKSSQLDIGQFNSVLLKANIKLSDDDLYHLFSEFDTNLDGKIDYVEFIEQLLDVSNNFSK